jgi:hypothetical protein
VFSHTLPLLLPPSLHRCLASVLERFLLPYEPLALALKLPAQSPIAPRPMSYDIPVPPLMSGLRTSPIPHNSTTLATFLQRQIRRDKYTSPWTSPPWIITIKIRNVWGIRVPATAAYDLTVRCAMIVLPPRQLRCARRVSCGWRFLSGAWNRSYNGRHTWLRTLN